LPRSNATTAIALTTAATIISDCLCGGGTGVALSILRSGLTDKTALTGMTLTNAAHHDGEKNKREAEAPLMRRRKMKDLYSDCTAPSIVESFLFLSSSDFYKNDTV
jgi:hypothetical protein